MIYIVALASFSMGFTLAVAIIARVNLRPRARKVLSQTGVLKRHRARVPKEKVEYRNPDDRVIG